MKLSEVKIFGEMCVMIYFMKLYVGSLQYVVSLSFTFLCYFLITRLIFFNILFMLVFLFFLSLFSVLCILRSCIALCIVSLVHGCLFPVFVQVYGPLPLGGNYHIISILPVFVSTDVYICHVSYVFVLVLSRIGNI